MPNAEAHGISRDIIEQSDEFIKIEINKESESLIPLKKCLNDLFKNRN